MTAPTTNPGGSAGTTAAVTAQLSAMMFLQFFVWGAWYVSAGNFMATKGLGDGISWAYSVGPIAAIVSPLFLGMIADRFFPSQRVLGVLHLLGAAAMVAAPSVAAASGPGEWKPFVGVLLAHMLCYMPTLGLSNTVAFCHVTNPEKQFPFIRVFGTLGWIAANAVVSKALHADKGVEQFYLTGAAAAVLGVYSFLLPHTPAPAAGKPFSLRDAVGMDALSMLRVPSFAVFIASSFLICIPLSAYYAYAPVYAGTMNFTDANNRDQTAFIMSFGQFAEIAFMLAIPFFFRRLGAKWMLATGMLAWAVRYGLFAGAAQEKVQWMVIAAIVLHGICYDFFFVTGQIYVDKLAPAKIRAQAQGFLVLVTQGAGMFVGAQAIGRIVAANTTKVGGADAIDWRAVWTIPALLAAAVLVVFVAAFRHKGDQPERPGEAG